MSQRFQGVGSYAFVPRSVKCSDRAPADDVQVPRKNPSVKDSISACAVLLGYVAVYMCVGFAVVALVGRAWLAVFE